MQRILNLYDWRHLPSDNGFTVTTNLEGPRAVRLRVNAPAPMALFLSQEDFAEELFLAHVVGLDEIEFHLEGSYQLIARGGDVWFDTLDGTDPAVAPVDPTSFTNIVERRERNPELELMEYMMVQNFEKRMNTLMEAKEAQIAASLKTAGTSNATSGATSGSDGNTPTPDGNTAGGNDGNANAE